MNRGSRKQVLDLKKVDLAETLDADKVVSELFDRDVIKDGIRDMILKMKTNKEKMFKIVDVLKVCKNNKYEVFCDIVERSGQEKLAQLLRQGPEGSEGQGKKNKIKGAAGSKRVTPSSRADSYADVFHSCRNCFISDVAADPETLVQTLQQYGKSVTLSAVTKRQIDLESDSEGKAGILFDAILPQINEYGSFFELVQVTRGPFQHLSNSMWEQLKNIVVPPQKSGSNSRRSKYSAGSHTSSLAMSPASMRDSSFRSPANGPSNDIMKSLTNLQTDLTESQSDSLKQSLQLEKCIQTTAGANTAIKKLKDQLKSSEEDRNLATAQADAAKQQAAEYRRQLETGLAEAEVERKRLEDQHHRWESQIRRRLIMLEQKETYLTSKEVELKRREDEQKQRNQLQRRQHDSLELKGLNMSQRSDRQDQRSADRHVREDKIRERENNIETKESHLAEQEHDTIIKESSLKKKEIELRRKEIEIIRLEEQIKVKQSAQRNIANQLKQREQVVSQAENDVKIINDNIRQREETLNDRERRLDLKAVQIKDKEEELRERQILATKKECHIQEVELEQREWESELEKKSQELNNVAGDADNKQQEIQEREEELELKKKELDSLQGVLDCRLHAQERMERALRMIELEQIRRDKEILNREADYYHLGNTGQGINDRLDELDRKDGEIKKREELLSWIEVEQQRREVELKRQEILAEIDNQKQPQDRPDGNGLEDEDRQSDTASPPMSTPLDADAEPEMHCYEITLKGARHAKSSKKSSFEIKVAGLQTVHAFKNIMEVEEGVPVSWQTICQGGQALDDSVVLPSSNTPGSLQKLDIKLASPSLRERDVIKLKVKSCNGPTHSVDFSLEDTVAIAKARIYKFTAIPPHQQLLSYKEVLLENHALLQLYSIRKNSTLDLRLRFLVTAEMSATERLEIMADETNTIANIKATIFERNKLPLDSIKITYRSKQLEDHRTLSHYNIEEGAVLQVTCSITVRMNATGTDLPLDIEPNINVRQLKQLLARKKNINVDRMYIVCGRDQILNDDHDVMELLRSGKEIGVHVGNILIMSNSGQILRESMESQQQQGDQTDLDLSVTSLNTAQLLR